MYADSGKKNVMRFAPVLYLKNVADGIAFYMKAFDAKELRKWTNDDGTVHVAEMMIGDSMFHMHEEVTGKRELSPQTLNATCVILGVFVDNPDEVIAKAIAAGAITIHPPQDYEYGYRQGDIKDPFGHRWTFQKVI